MKAETIRIRNGRIVDTAQGIDRVGDLYIADGRIVPYAQPDLEIDASGCVVSAGLIDAHSHVYITSETHRRAPFPPTVPDVQLAYGVTSMVDAGSSGVDNFEDFYRTVIRTSEMRIKAFVCLSSGGMSDKPDEHMDLTPFLNLAAAYPDVILGAKVYYTTGSVPEGEKGVLWLRHIVNTLQQHNPKLRVCVHITNAPVPAGAIADCLRKGDIFCHCFHGHNHSILLEDGNIDERVWEAKRRGVLFDVAPGMGNMSLSVTQTALQAGLYPDLLGSDMTRLTFNKPYYTKNLPFEMGKLQALGMREAQVWNCCTAAAAHMMGEPSLGTLQEGTPADIAIFKEQKQKYTIAASDKYRLTAQRRLVPQLTLRDGMIVYSAPDFWI